LTRHLAVTGATSGIGKQTALEFAKHSPSQLWITGRNVANGAQVVAELKSVVSEETSVKFVELDLTSFDSIKAAAQIILSSAPRLDILMLNAGIVLPPLLSLLFNLN
jgi:retinol dehydrogenase-12